MPRHLDLHVARSFSLPMNAQPLFRRTKRLTRQFHSIRMDYNGHPRSSTHFFRDARRNCRSQCSIHEHDTHHRSQIRETPIAFNRREAQSTLSYGAYRRGATCCLREFAHLCSALGQISTPSHARSDRERNAAYFTYLRFHESVRRMISRPTGSNGSIAAASAPCSCAERCLLPPPWFISWALLPRRKQKGRMQDGFVI